MSVPADDLRRVVRTIWSTQLGLGLEDTDLEQVEALLTDREVVAITVQLGGDFTGVLVQRCSRSVSLVAAASAFATNGNDLEASDLRDALSELAHMTAGNLKSILPGRCDVSFPTSVDHERRAAEVVAAAGFTLEGEPLIVTLERSLILNS